MNIQIEFPDDVIETLKTVHIINKNCCFPAKEEKGVKKIGFYTISSKEDDSKRNKAVKWGLMVKKHRNEFHLTHIGKILREKLETISA